MLKLVKKPEGEIPLGSVAALGKTVASLRQNDEGKLPRLRLASSVDLTMADKDCPRCKGSGVERYIRHVERRKGFRPVSKKIPVVCRCVVKNAGVAKDALDAVMKAHSERYEQRKAEMDQAAKDGREVNVRERGGYNTLDATWVCQTCGNVALSPGLQDGVPLLALGWRMARGRAFCDLNCQEAYEREMDHPPGQ